jgi:hypothetical protein
VFATWKALTSQTYNYFYLPDAPYLDAICEHLGFEPSLCVTRVKKESVSHNNRVYTFSLPRITAYGSNRTSKLCVCLNHVDFCVKLTNRREYETCGAIREHFQIQNPSQPFYCFASFPLTKTRIQQRIEVTTETIANKTKALVSNLISAAQKSDLILQVSSVVVNSALTASNVKDVNNDRKFALLMYEGERIPDELSKEDRNLVADGGIQTLEAIHAAGYLHTDVRNPNILKFIIGGKISYQIIDYDHCVSQSSPSVTFVKGAQYDARGLRFEDCMIGDTVMWKSADDYQMLIKMYLSL